MPEFRTLSLTSALNEQLIADEGKPASAVGIDGYVIPRAEWNDGVARLAKVPPFSFAAEGNDHLFCDGQTLPLSPGVRKLHFLGFSYWGDAFDEVAVRLSDGRTKTIGWCFRTGRTPRKRSLPTRRRKSRKTRCFRRFRFSPPKKTAGNCFSIGLQ